MTTGSIIVAIVCNLVAVLILLSGVLSTVKAGIRVAGLRLLFTLAGGVGAFFLTPVISKLVAGIVVEAATETAVAVTLFDVISKLGISLAAFNSVIYLITFVVFYLFGTIICNIVKHVLIKGVRAKAVNAARVKRAKSINAKAERVARKAQWKAMKAEYKAKLPKWRRFLSAFLGGISAIVMGFVVLNTYGFIAKDLVKADSKNQFLTDGYKYTINGVIEEKIDFDFGGWLVGAEAQPETAE